MNLNLGCGSDYREGYINIDNYTANLKIDRVFDCNEPLDYPDESVEEILAIHLLEHLRPKGIDRVVKSWYRVLKKGGKLIIELPDFDSELKQALENQTDSGILKWIFGNQERPGQDHLWGWNKIRLLNLLRDAGFNRIDFTEPQDYRKEQEPCLRVKAIK